MQQSTYSKLQKRWALLSVVGALVIIVGYPLDSEVVGWVIGFLLILVSLFGFVVTALVQLLSGRKNVETPAPGPTPPAGAPKITSAPPSRIVPPIWGPRPEPLTASRPREAAPATPPQPQLAPVPPPSVPTEREAPEAASQPAIAFEMEPADQSIVYGEETWIRWKPFHGARGRVFWRGSGSRDFRLVEPSPNLPAVARLAPLSVGKTYEYYVEQQRDEQAWRSELRQFRVEAGITFVPRGVEAAVARDYDQKVKVTVRNTTSAPVRVAAGALPELDDLPADLTGPGSTDEPVELQPGQSIDLNLVINAADAKREEYEIPINAAGATGMVRLRVPRPKLKLAIRVISEDAATLAKRVEVRNEGETVGDLAIRLASPADSEARIEPSADHAYLSTGKAVAFTVTPLLYLEFEALDAILECSAASQTVTFPLDFRAPAGKRLIGVRTACQHSSCASDWFCTNRPNIIAALVGPEAFGVPTDDISFWLHTALDVAGLFPVLGAFPDGINSAIYILEGNWEDAALSGIAMIPLFGDGATVSKYGVKITREAAERMGRRGMQEAVLRSVYGREEMTTIYRRMQPRLQPQHWAAARSQGIDGYRRAINESYPGYEDLRRDTRRLNQLWRENFPGDPITDARHDVHHILERNILNHPQFQDDLRRLGWDSAEKMPSIALPYEFHIRTPQTLGPGRMPVTANPDVTSLTWILRHNVNPAEYGKFSDLARAYENAYRANLDARAWEKMAPLFDYINEVIPFRVVGSAM